jgi:hypothetical protein
MLRFERIETRLTQSEFSDELIEIMSQAAHEAFCEGLTSLGFQYGPENDSDLKTHPALVTYETLSEDLKEASRANVRTLGPKTDPLRKIHASLVVWDELSEVEREKDREMVRSIPKILAEAGFVIVVD